MSLYKDGALLDVKARLGALSSWDPQHALVIGNEFQLSRPWAGEVYLAALYDRALTEDEVQRNFRVGPVLDGATPSGNGTPTLAITAPADGTSVGEGTRLTFEGTATDGGGADMSNRIFWSSSLDGGLGAGGSLPALLSLGAHRIRASFVDNDGVRTSRGVNVTVTSGSGGNTSPSVTISAPANGSSVEEGTSVSFRGTASDAEDGDISSRIGWTSSRDGALGGGAAIAKTLTVGSHTITARAADAGGLAASSSISVTVTAKPTGGGSPTLTITAPADGTSVAQGTRLTFEGTATDGKGADMSNRIFWSSSLDRGLGAGGSVPALLSVGAHRVRASFVDNDGLRTARGVNITITPRTGPNAAPIVEAGDDQTVLTRSAELYGSVVDDGLPSSNLTMQWSKASGPGDVAFIEPAAMRTSASFSQPGEYVLRLTADDTEMQSADEVAVDVVDSPRVREGLIAFYPFNEGQGETAADQSGNGDPLNLTLSAGVQWLSGKTGVQIPKKERLFGAQAGKIHRAVQQSGLVSVEVWAKAENLSQGGPARIVSYSYDGYNRNFTLGQQGENLQVRFRTKTKTAGNLNGYPYLLAEQAITTEPAHFMLTYDGVMLSLYKDGQLLKSEPREGTLASWDPAYALVIGDEFEDLRPWIGEVYLVALYNRALNDVEVQRNFQVGPDLTNGGQPVANQAPLVSAGKDQTVLLPMTSARLYGGVVDDGLPNGAVTMQWSKVSGPGDVTFDDAAALQTSAAFSNPGQYILRLTGDDSAAQSSDEVAVVVTQSPRVSDGLVAFYPFNEGQGPTAADQSGAGAPLDLALSEGAVALARDSSGSRNPVAATSPYSGNGSMTSTRPDDSSRTT